MRLHTANASGNVVVHQEITPSAIDCDSDSAEQNVFWEPTTDHPNRAHASLGGSLNVACVSPTTTTSFD
ncbi:hypothetical protein [Acidisoma sp. L85]|uniref:hypothetical protein n=1 Tax=Acidisoma sp. L85 TaxID=1641850 RepID=UPI00131AF1FC|nr:hypothetical protein [Acidisoma sp. L85]